MHGRQGQGRAGLILPALKGQDCPASVSVWDVVWYVPLFRPVFNLRLYTRTGYQTLRRFGWGPRRPPPALPFLHRLGGTDLPGSSTGANTGEATW